MGKGLSTIGTTVWAIMAKQLLRLSIKDHGRGFVPHASFYKIDLGISM